MPARVQPAPPAACRRWLGARLAGGGAGALSACCWSSCSATRRARSTSTRTSSSRYPPGRWQWAARSPRSRPRAACSTTRRAWLRVRSLRLLYNHSARHFPGSREGGEQRVGPARRRHRSHRGAAALADLRARLHALGRDGLRLHRPSRRTGLAAIRARTTGVARSTTRWRWARPALLRWDRAAAQRRALHPRAGGQADAALAAPRRRHAVGRAGAASGPAWTTAAAS